MANLADEEEKAKDCKHQIGVAWTALTVKGRPLRPAPALPDEHVFD
jgi:hypothetical protein